MKMVHRMIRHLLFSSGSLLPVVGGSWVALKLGPVSTLAVILLFGAGLISAAGFRRKPRKT